MTTGYCVHGPASDKDKKLLAVVDTLTGGYPGTATVQAVEPGQVLVLRSGCGHWIVGQPCASTLLIHAFVSLTLIQIALNITALHLLVIKAACFMSCRVGMSTDPKAWIQ